MPRPIRAAIDGVALRHNLETARRHAGDARVWAVVKANAYGHGLGRAVRVLGAADGLAVLDLDEALRLRTAGWRKPILLLEGFFSAADLAVVASHGLTPVVHSAEQVRMLEQAGAAEVAGTGEIYLKVNSGMNRLGVAPEAAADIYRRLVALRPGLAVTLMTHFADADGASGVAAQLAVFERAMQGLPGLRSVANSAALLRFPEARADWVRPGIILYGGSPFPDRSAADLGLHPVMTLRSELISVRQLRPGDRVGYGCAFKAETPMAVGVVACGYADGYPRHAPTGTPILVGGRRTRTVGRVSMDMICVDLSGLPEAQVGAPVTLWGEGLAADEVAAAAGTVSYELFCALALRVPVVETGFEASANVAPGTGAEGHRN